MAWTVRYTETALRQLRNIDRQQARRIRTYLEHRVARAGDVRHYGKPLHGPLGDLWRYRVGDYRVIADIEDDRLTVLVLTVGHRREVYRQR